MLHVVTLNFPYRFYAAVIALHGYLLLMMSFLGVSVEFKIISIAGLCGSLFYQLMRKNAVIRLSVGKVWCLHHRNGRLSRAELLPNSFLSAVVCILTFRLLDESSKNHTVVVTPSSSVFYTLKRMAAYDKSRWD